MVSVEAGGWRKARRGLEPAGRVYIATHTLLRGSQVLKRGRVTESASQGKKRNNRLAKAVHRGGYSVAMSELTRFAELQTLHQSEKAAAQDRRSPDPPLDRRARFSLGDTRGHGERSEADVRAVRGVYCGEWGGDVRDIAVLGSGTSPLFSFLAMLGETSLPHW